MSDTFVTQKIASEIFALREFLLVEHGAIGWVHTLEVWREQMLDELAAGVSSGRAPIDLALVEYPATDACATTGAPRFHRVCRCKTYPGNWGACPEWIPGANGNCAYCDHAKSCHRVASTPTPQETHE
jgi:hypothetical protein